MKIAVVGSRDFTDYERLCRTLDALEFDLLISGGARGADKLAERYADERGIKKHIYYAEWGKLGKKAGIMRNEDIVKNSDMIVAFWDGKSRGTNHTIQFAQTLGKPVIIKRF